MAEIALKDHRHGNTRLSKKQGQMKSWHQKSKGVV